MTADFQTQQRQFAAHVRNPDQAPLPEGCDADRMRHYHRLFFNNFDGVLESTFPRLRASLPDEEWDWLVHTFFRDTPQHSPFLADVPARFADFLAEFLAEPSSPTLTPGQEELAAFELACFELRKAEDPEPAPELTADDDLLAGHPVPNPDSLLFESDFPVHDPAWSPIEGAAQPTFLCLIRDDAGQIRVQTLSAASALLLALIAENPGASGAEIIEELCRQSGLPPDETRHRALAQLEDWRRDGVLLGSTRRTASKR